MFARAARASRRRALFRRTLLITGPPFLLAGAYASGTSPVRNESSQSSFGATDEKTSPELQESKAGVFASWRQRFTSGDDDADSSSDANEDPSDPSWSAFSRKFSEAGNALTALDWGPIGDRITGSIVPKWAASIPSYIRKLQNELEWKPGSLADEILQESADPTINPEVEWTARVRVGKDLCAAEQDFQQRRRQHIVKALAKYLDIPEKEIHPNDVPVIAMCGSGGGLRALVAGANSSLCTQEAGLWDCVMYTAGVSGSCWMQALYHSSMAGQNFQHLINHLKRRIGIHIAFPPPALNLLATAPTNKFLLSGLLEKSRADPKADFGLVDVYGLLLAARLFVPRGELEIDPRDLKLSNQRANIDDGSHPLPIYTAVRHEIPPDGEDHKTSSRVRRPRSEAERQKAQQEAWFQWFEWTPYEFFCEEIEAGIPTWSLGRMFQDGVSLPRDNGLGLPEMRVPQLLGIWGSAFCATLSHYYAEIRPLVKGLAGFGGIDELIEERNSDLIKVHPIDPASIPNYAKGLGQQLPSSASASILNDDHLQLMDAGMSNNLPIYPLLRPGRDVDVLIAFDASADPKSDNWLARVDGYVRQRGIAGWPMGAGWPPSHESAEEAAKDLETTQDQTSTEDIEAQLAAGRAEETRNDATTKELGHCTIWLGSTQEREVPGSESRSDASKTRPDATRFESTLNSSPDSTSSSGSIDWTPLPPDAGLAVIYFPLTPNEKVPGVDPMTTSYLSTWNFVYTPEQVDSVGKLARANWEEGAEQTKRCIRAVYERKKRAREEGEQQAQNRRRALMHGHRTGVWEGRWQDGDGLV